FIGRVDSQVKIRGFRIELGEIEHQLTQLPQVESSYVMVREDRLVAYVVTDGSDVSESELRQGQQNALPEYMMPSFFVNLEALPLTTNGKVDQQALPDPDVSQLPDEFVALTTGTQIGLAEIWCAILKVDKLSATANFFESGGHSLLSLQVIGEVRCRFDVELTIKDIFEASQLDELANLIELSSGETRPQVVAIERTSNLLPTSFAQQRLWFIDQLDESSVQYNMPGALRFKGVFIEAVVEQAFTRIIERHEPLRTVFVDTPNGVQQLIRDTFEFTLTKTDVSLLSENEQKAVVKKALQTDSQTVFNLNDDLMLRSHFIRLSADEGVLLFNLHHIASDGWSAG
ncbi:MAG: condensation domain-containing protein, partial [Psychrosphaera sp.]|nr:condensation domain-containing protein [Psychrosphaera sp.]